MPLRAPWGAGASEAMPLREPWGSGASGSTALCRRLGVRGRAEAMLLRESRGSGASEAMLLRESRGSGASEALLLRESRGSGASASDAPDGVQGRSPCTQSPLSPRGGRGGWGCGGQALRDAGAAHRLRAEPLTENQKICVLPFGERRFSFISAKFSHRSTRRQASYPCPQSSSADRAPHA